MRYSLILAAFSLVHYSCNQESNESVPAGLRLSGQITNPLDSLVIIYHDKRDDTLTLAEDGTFSGYIELLKNGRLSLKNGDERTAFYAVPGDSLHISFDGSQFDESIVYSGTSPGSSTFLAAKYLQDENISGSFPTDRLYLFSPSRFLEVSDSLSKLRTDALELGKSTIHEELYTSLKLENLYTWARSLKIYPEYAAWFQQNDSIEIPENFMSSIADVPFENSDALDVPAYQRYAEEQLHAEVNLRFEARDQSPEDMDYMKEMLICADSLFTKQAVKEYFLNTAMKMTVDYFGTRDLTEQFAFFSSKSSNKEHLEELEKEYASWAHLAAGKVAPDFSYKNLEGSLVSLSDFKGKVVYVDVWATWCGPCRGEIPSLHALSEEMKNEDIVFMSVSVDDSQEDWEKMVTEDGLDGVQVITGTGWKSKITEDYKVSGIPRFMLIDKDGKIVSADAPRPSENEKIVSMMMGALNNTETLAVKLN